jgi:hypothetical protein
VEELSFEASLVLQYGHQSDLQNIFLKIQIFLLPNLARKYRHSLKNPAIKKENKKRRMRANQNPP